jgi:hypothetical protein
VDRGQQKQLALRFFHALCMLETAGFVRPVAKREDRAKLLYAYTHFS